MSIASKMFEIEVSFSSPTGIDIIYVLLLIITLCYCLVQMGQSVEVTLAITSKFEGAMDFAKMIVHFTGDAVVQTFSHGSSNDKDRSGGNIDNSILAPLVFEYNKPMIFKFNCVISESCLNSCVAQDSYMGIEKVILIEHYHININSYDNTIRYNLCWHLKTALHR